MAIRDKNDRHIRAVLITVHILFSERIYICRELVSAGSCLFGLADIKNPNKT